MTDTLIDTQFDQAFTDNRETINQLGLTAWDKEHMELAGTRIFKKILSDYPNELPDLVILPDTSARPLLYLAEPIFSAIAESRHVQKPSFAFMWVHFPYSKGVTQEIILNNTKDQSFSYYINNPNSFLPKKAETRKAAIEARSTNKKRADEIVSKFVERYKLDKGYKPKIISIDDGASEFAATCREVSVAFGKPVPTYTLLSQFTQEFFLEKGIPVVIGETSKKDSFDYRRDEHAYGIYKDDFYLEPKYVIPQSDPYDSPDDKEDRVIKIFSLRTDIKAVGQKIAKNLLVTTL